MALVRLCATLYNVLNFSEVTNVIAVLGLKLDEGRMTQQLKARLDAGFEEYQKSGGRAAIVVCGSHSFGESAKYNEADVMAKYLWDTYGYEALKEGYSDSVQNNLLFLRELAPRISVLTVVCATEAENRVGQCKEWLFPHIKSYAFRGCPEPNIKAERELKLGGDFHCIVTNFAKMKKGDPAAYKKLLDGMTSRWAYLRDEHHKTCQHGKTGSLHPDFRF